MSNATKTSKTGFLGIRVPLDLLARIDAGGSRTAVVLDALRRVLTPDDPPPPTKANNP